MAYYGTNRVEQSCRTKIKNAEQRVAIQYLTVTDGAVRDVVPIAGSARRDDVVEAGECEGQHRVELHAGVPLLEVAPPHPPFGHPRLHAPEHPKRVPPQDVTVPQPRQLPRPAAPRQLPPPLRLLGVRPVSGVHRRAPHVERRRRRGLDRSGARLIFSIASGFRNAAREGD